MATYTLKLHIDPNQLQTMKRLNYNLCIAKKVNGVYTVVWQGDQQYLVDNTFEWTENYQVFGTNTFEKPTQDILYGQKSILNSAGVVEGAIGTPNTSGIFRVDNNYGLIHIGVNGKMGIHGKAGNLSPIFVSPTVVAGTATLKPINTLKIWFSTEYSTSTMIFKADEPGIELDFTGRTSAKISYTGTPGLGKWAEVPMSF
ncbi:hypothetical protein VNI00_012528 [Paramarasmius palmivorus]|uniref:Uncharacterized protein n=1 Tax=Paramarasmius palmivorus TaxID=297713 RepID=A0AAW0C3S6_9AGAR